MSIHPLILGGTTEATALCVSLADQGVSGIISFAGRVARPVRQPLPQRMGGFGGIEGLADYILREKITHVIDATHPFAAQMSRHAVAACAETGTPLMALTRAPWTPVAGDHWHTVADTNAAVTALDRPACSVMLAIGRMTLDAFAVHPQHMYLLRLVDPPRRPPPFPKHHIEVSRGPFTTAGDLALMQRHGVSLVVSKNAGGRGAYAKIAAARALQIPVIMIGRPPLPARPEAYDVDHVTRWLTHADLGV